MRSLSVQFSFTVHFAISSLAPVVADSIGSFLIQHVVSLCSEELFEELHQKLFKGKIVLFAKHPNANFVLQKLIKACKKKEIVSLIVLFGFDVYLI